MSAGTEPPSWTRRALCSRFPDITFVPDPFLGEESRPAKGVCAHCPVVEECRAFRDQEPRVGVWGGEDEVDWLLRRGVPSMIPCSKCNTNSAVMTVLGLVCMACGDVER